MIWKIDRKESFSIRSYYLSLVFNVILTFPQKLIWNSRAPSKIGYFEQEAAWRKILTLDQLKKRGWSLPIVAIPKHEPAVDSCAQFGVLLLGGMTCTKLCLNARYEILQEKD